MAEGRLSAKGCLAGAADDLLGAALDTGGNHPAIAQLRTALDLGKGVSNGTRSTCNAAQLEATCATTLSSAGLSW